MAFGLDDLKNAGDIKDVWDNVNPRTWEGFFSAVQTVREAKGDNETLDKLEAAGRAAEAEGHAFPDDPAELATLLHNKS